MSFDALFGSLGFGPASSKLEALIDVIGQPTS
jgi:hypothetical protein